MRQARISEPAAISRDGSILGVIFRSNFRGTSRSAPPGQRVPAHSHHLGAGVGVVADDGSRIVGKPTRHRRQIADVAVDNPEQRDDRGLVGGDAVQVADRFLLRMSIRVIRALGGPPTVSDADPIQPRLHVAALPYPSARPLSIALSGPVLAPRVLRPVQGKAIPHQPFTEIRCRRSTWQQCAHSDQG